MASDVVVPEVGEAGMDVTFLRWLKAAGDQVAAGEVLFELDTDKSVVEVEAWTSGTLSDLRAAPGDIVSPRQVVARILGPDELADGARAPAPSDPFTATHPTATHPTTGDVPGGGRSSAVPGVTPSAAAGPGGMAASPRARRLARERGLDLSTVAGTGADGMITERDVLAALGEPEG
jgi:pyruvate/2-oxoglutarate dehydrogenase complex dihydrolipoamide acyltransferase (E2) component